jgi:hypothetical protein
MELCEAVDWALIPGTRWYRPELAAAAAGALTGASTPRQVAQAVADLRRAVSNDHAGILYPAAVPAAGVLVQVVLGEPGEPRKYALETLLDWWGCFGPEPGFEVYDDPVAGPAAITEGIMERVRRAGSALSQLVADSPAGLGEHRRGILKLLSFLDRGWVTDDR